MPPGTPGPVHRFGSRLVRSREVARVVVAIALWNSTYIQAAIDQLTLEGWDISRPDIARVSPLLFKHINFLGRYAFDLPQAVAEGALRPLRNPTSE
jgi:hypothetical protein